MLFVTADEIKKHISDAQVLFAGVEVFDKDYSFQEIYYTDQTKEIALTHNKSTVIKCFIKDCIKFLLGKHTNLWRFKELEKAITSIDLIMDISGYNLGKKWTKEIQESYLDNIRLAKAYGIPIVLMPQSFGPFDYPGKKKYLINEMAELLPYAKKIFAREKEGYQMLLDTFALSNVELSTDLVLQNKGIDQNNIYQHIPEIKVPVIEKGTVGIIPNKQCFIHGNKDEILAIYGKITEKLTKEGKKVCFFMHSREDEALCNEIYRYCKRDNTRAIVNDFNCIEFDAFVRQFDFIICSRYHGIVHAYRNSIPCILLGWATKYTELSQLLDQGEYCFDLTKVQVNTDKIIKAVEKMCCRYEDDAKIIKERLKAIQQDNCFDKALQ